MAESSSKGGRGKQAKTTVIEVPQTDSFGHKQPQQLDFEAAVLGALLNEQDAYYAVSDILRPDVFYDHRHKLIYEAIQSLAINRRPVDLLTVQEQLAKDGKLEEAGGAYYIVELSDRVITSAHIEAHAQVLLQKYQARRLITISSTILQKAFDETTDIPALMQEAQAALFELSQQTQSSSFTQINPLIEKAIEKVKLAGKRKDKISGVPSGFEVLDKITGGWQNSDLIIIAARPGMGKTAFVLSMIKNMAVDENIPVAMFSMEMANLQLINRLIMNVSEIRGETLKIGDLRPDEWTKLYTRVEQLNDAPVFVDDSPSLSIFDLCTKARRLVREHAVKAIMIDYLQLMNASGIRFGNRQEEVSTISRNLKSLAKELNIPIIALSQLNRGVESREGNEGKRPQLSDLRESGAIEQDADLVCFIHRPEYYRIYEDEKHKDVRGKAEIIVAKHRNGPSGALYLNFKAEFARFENESDYVPMPGEQSIVSKMNQEEMDAIASMKNVIVPESSRFDSPANPDDPPY